MIGSTFKNAIDALESQLKIACDDLAQSVGVFDSPDLDDLLLEGDGGGARIDAEALKDLLTSLRDTQVAVTQAIVDFDWSVGRALRDFRQALADSRKETIT
jgi:hypothetical protein